MQYDVIAPAAAGTTADPDWISAWASHVEQCGFDGVVAVEHSVVLTGYESRYPYAESGRMELADDCDIPDPLELLSFLAGCTSDLGLATGVLVLPNHHPVVLAKRLATLDALSRGRLRVCVGMGWMREEIEACGTDFETRGTRADEQIVVLRDLWASTPPAGASHHGEFFGFDGALSYPKPQRLSGIPVHIGGHSRAAARRAGRLGDGLQPLGVAGDQLTELLAVMRSEAEREGRDPDALELTLGHLVGRVDDERAQRLADLGAVRLVLATSATDDLREAMDELSSCAERLGLGGAA